MQTSVTATGNRHWRVRTDLSHESGKFLYEAGDRLELVVLRFFDVEGSGVTQFT